MVWGLITGLAFLALLRKRPPVYVAIALPSVVGMLGMETVSAGVSWSPYYKVTTFDDGFEAGVVHIAVNGVPHQAIRSTESRLTQEPQYSVPYERLSPGESPDVLIIGAGSGSDVAIALAKGAGHVDAVEIDPRIQQIGEQRHPDLPDQSVSVETHIEDGRAFFERSRKRYDLVLFALPDSLALVNGASAIRLESYLFTTEAIETAREHLRPGGGLALYNYYREDRLIEGWPAPWRTPSGTSRAWTGSVWARRSSQWASRRRPKPVVRNYRLRTVGLRRRATTGPSCTSSARFYRAST